MEIQSALNAGLEGFNKATEDANKAAANIAAQTTFNNSSASASGLTQSNTQSSAQNSASVPALTDAPSINQSIVDLKVAEFQAKASAEVIQTADETLGTLLDVRV
jgi:hypothetical protein